MNRDTAAPLTDWATTFLDGGWQPHAPFAYGVQRCIPWIALEIVAGIGKNDSDASHGWMHRCFGFRVLHAPMFYEFGAPETKQAIIDAIRVFPVQRAMAFERDDRPFYVAQRFSESLIAELAPKPDQPLVATSFKRPILMFVRDPSTGCLTMLSCAGSFNFGFQALLECMDVPIDEGLSLLVLFTCLANAGDTRSKHAAFRRPLSQPFHLRRLKQIRAAIEWRSSPDSADEHFGERLRLLHKHIPAVVEDLRSNPSFRTPDLIAAVRSRLAEAVSDDLLTREPRKRAVHPGRRWSEQFTQLSGQQQAVLMKALSAGERNEVAALIDGEMTVPSSSTRRVLRSRAFAKLRNVLSRTSA